MAHFPYAIFAVALSLIALSVLGYGALDASTASHAHGLFHTLHFLHILFASTGTVIVFRKFGGGKWRETTGQTKEKIGQSENN